MQTKQETINALSTIRSVIDADVSDCDIESVREKLLKLTSIMGLSAETMATVKKFLNDKEIEVFAKMDLDMAPSIAKKFLDAHCKEENAMFTYADRLNSSIVHQIDALRTVISLHKSELENSLKQ